MPATRLAGYGQVGVWGITMGPGSMIQAGRGTDQARLLSDSPHALEDVRTIVVSGATQAGGAGSRQPDAMLALPSRPSPATTAAVAPDESVCAACGAPLAQAGRGRRRRFCPQACREAARLRRERGLPESTPRARPVGRRRLGAGDGPTKRETT